MEWLTNEYLQAVLYGLGGAVVVDVLAFRSWKSWEEAASYSWGVASFRWFQGAIGGLITLALLKAGIAVAS